MSSYLGLDPTAVRALANQMSTTGGEIQHMAAQLTSMLANTPWTGPDHDRFASEWQSTHLTQLQAVVNALAEAAHAANTNAMQQEQASNS